MQIVLHRWIPLFIMLVAIGCSFSARADYQFTTVDYPGSAVATQLWGINNSGQIVGQAFLADGSSLSFIYDSKKGSFTSLPTIPDSSVFLGINEKGTTVGSVSDAALTFEHGLILDKKGDATTFVHPAPLTNTLARAIGASGLVTGYAYDDAVTTTTGFIYDSRRNTFIDILPSTVGFTIAQGINARGDVVGSTSSPTDVEGFLRESNGTITLFKANGAPTRARGITDSGQIAGFINGSGGLEGFVGTLSDGFELLNVPDATDTFVQGIANSGAVVGSYIDAAGNSHGFIATPLPPKKK
jgi:hypothetical protein